MTDTCIDYQIFWRTTEISSKVTRHVTLILPHGCEGVISLGGFRQHGYFLADPQTWGHHCGGLKLWGGLGRCSRHSPTTRWGPLTAARHRTLKDEGGRLCCCCCCCISNSFCSSCVCCICCRFSKSSCKRFLKYGKENIFQLEFLGNSWIILINVF